MIGASFFVNTFAIVYEAAEGAAGEILISTSYAETNNINIMEHAQLLGVLSFEVEAEGEKAGKKGADEEKRLMK